MKAKAILESYRERSTVLTMNAPEIPAIEAGKQKVCTILYKTNVQLSDIAPVKGIAYITNGYIENGFAYYTALMTNNIGKAGSIILRQKDINLDWVKIYEVEAQKRALFNEFMK